MNYGTIAIHAPPLLLPLLLPLLFPLSDSTVTVRMYHAVAHSCEVRHLETTVQYAILHVLQALFALHPCA